MLFILYLWLCDDVYRQSLAKKQEELRGYEMQINNATKGVDLDSSLVSVQSKLQTHQEYVFFLPFSFCFVQSFYLQKLYCFIF